MTRERINDFKKIVLPSISKLLFDINYEGQGKCDAEEFAKDFNEILDLAAKALENKPKFILHSDGKIEQIIEPCDDLLDKIKTEIEQVAEEEREHDKRWAQGLKYALMIIDKQKIESEAAEQ